MGGGRFQRSDPVLEFPEESRHMPALVQIAEMAPVFGQQCTAMAQEIYAGHWPLISLSMPRKSCGAGQFWTLGVLLVPFLIETGRICAFLR